LPIQFATLEDVALPARQGATVDVRIRALPISSGTQGNLPSQSITRVAGELSGSITVQNLNPTFGGGVRETAFVTQTDRDRLVTLARQQVIQDARNVLLVSLDESSSFLVSDSIRIADERTLIYSAEVNEPVDSISLTMQGLVEATLIDLNEARQVAFANLGNYLAEGRIIDNQLLDYRRGEVTEILDDGRVAFQMRVQGSTRVRVDTQEAADIVAGKSEADARAALERAFELDPRRPPEVDTWPPFFNRMPLFSSRIQIEIRS